MLPELLRTVEEERVVEFVDGVTLVVVLRGVLL